MSRRVSAIVSQAIGQRQKRFGNLIGTQATLLPSVGQRHCPHIDTGGFNVDSQGPQITPLIGTSASSFGVFFGMREHLRLFRCVCVEQQPAGSAVRNDKENTEQRRPWFQGRPPPARKRGSWTNAVRSLAQSRHGVETRSQSTTTSWRCERP